MKRLDWLFKFSGDLLLIWDLEPIVSRHKGSNIYESANGILYNLSYSQIIRWETEELNNLLSLTGKESHGSIWQTLDLLTTESKYLQGLSGAS
jgi:hypothetical protein